LNDIVYNCINELQTCKRFADWSDQVSKRLLVTYGFHRGEKFAEQVGIEYAKLDMPNVVTARIRGIRGDNRLAQMRRDIGAKYLVDLHDDSTALQRLGPEGLRNSLALEREANPNARYDLDCHMPYSQAIRVLKPFAEKWNERRRRARM
jgi:hypothetical protein